MDEPYNPLDRVNLARSVELTLLQRPCHELPLPKKFNGAGLYAIYYQGPFPAYAPISSPECAVPIYVGEAMPSGARTGLTDLAASVGPVLFNRLRDHWKSIDAAKNLDVTDFRVRYLLVEDIFIAMGEAILIAHYQPLWNSVMSGFGLHDPGAGRHGSERSDWDELHPGRPWYSKMKQARKPAEITKRIADVFASGKAATLTTPTAGETEAAPAEVVEAPPEGTP